MKILNLLTIIDKKHPLYVFFLFYLKLQNLEIVGLLSHRDYEQNTYF
jgi:hypothetical protein